MQIRLPKRLRYSDLQSILLKHFSDSFSEATEVCNFDWSQVLWVSFPEMVTILSWSSRLIQSTKSVNWILPDPRPKLAHVSDYRQNMRNQLGNEQTDGIIRQIEQVRKDALNSRLYPGERRSRIAAISATAAQNQEELASKIEAWLDAELGELAFLDILGFLRRYQTFDRALEVGVTFSPDPRTLPFALLGTTPGSTPCLELRPIHSATDTMTEVERLCNPKELGRILGQYVDLDVVRRGALAQILVNELGRNVAEHASATAAWLCTRLVKSSDVNHQMESDPVQEAVKQLTDGFLEIIICDNGLGLASTLEPVIQADPRRSVVEKYRNHQGKLSPEDLVDYAFDRLSSRKRNIEELVHWDTNQKSDPGPLASGLYWVWNLVRGHHGVLAVRSSGVSGWYDFGRTDDSDGAPEPFQRDAGEFPCCGTMIRVFLPLGQPTTAPWRPNDQNDQMPQHDALSGDTLHPQNEHISVWVGDLAREAYQNPLLVTGAAVQQATLPLLRSSPEILLFQKLKEEHSRLPHGGVLIFNLCGARKLWTKQSAAPLCHFFLHMNYTSVTGHSTIVLWNVPVSASEVFKQAIEQASKPYAHLKELRRMALLFYDNGSPLLVCSSPEIGNALRPLASTHSLSLSDLDIRYWPKSQIAELLKLIRENQHLFKILKNEQITLRTTYADLRAEAWKVDMEWLEGLLRTDVGTKRDGARGLRRTAGDGFFRLPSSGHLIKVFYSLSSFLCNHENCARLAWMFHQLILEIEKTVRNKVQWIVCLTRSVSPLAQHLRENYLDQRGQQAPKFIVAETIEVLKRRAEELRVAGTAIFITDVISTGATTRRVRAALRDTVQWMGTIAVLDTRTGIEPKQIVEDAGPAQGIHYFCCDGLATGLAYVLSHIAIRKIDPILKVATRIQAIDPVNLLPVKPPQLPESIKSIWPLLERKPEALKIGHYCNRADRHYVYYVIIKELLEATWPENNQTLRDLLLDKISKTLAEQQYNPNYSIILYPPEDESEGHTVAEFVQKGTDILYRHILHRDAFASQERFSTFIEHGEKVPNRTAVVIDDGANSGETLMGLLDAAAFDSPKRVLAFCAVARLPLHKLDFFCRMNRLGDNIYVSVNFATQLSIPVFSRNSCPICRFANGLKEVIHRSPLLKVHAQQLLKKIEPQFLEKPSHETEPPWLWECTSSLVAARLRECIELADYREQERSEVEEVVARACQVGADDDAASAALLNLAFVISCEPDLIEASIFAPHLEKFAKAVASKLYSFPESQILTLFTLSFYATVQRAKKGDSPESVGRTMKLVVAAIVSRVDLSISMIGGLLASALAEVWPESEPDSEACRSVCLSMASALQETLTRSLEDQNNHIKAYGCFLSRELLSDISRETSFSVSGVSTENWSLFDCANTAAAKFFWHAREKCAKQVSEVLKQAQAWVSTSYNVVTDVMNDLCLAFNDLHELRRRLEYSERELERQGASSGASTHWKSPLMASLLDRFGTAIAMVAQSLDESNPRKDMRDYAKELEAAWLQIVPQLQLAFEDIFPQVIPICGDQFNRFGDITRFPKEVFERLSVTMDDHLSEHSRVFVPRVVLENFFENALRNLRTAAFVGWTPQEICLEAQIGISVRRIVGHNNVPMVEIGIEDNGPLYRRGQPAEQTEQRGLQEIRMAAEQFEGELLGPSTTASTTKVVLRLRHRIIDKGLMNES